MKKIFDYQLTYYNGIKTIIEFKNWRCTINIWRIFNIIWIFNFIKYYKFYAYIFKISLEIYALNTLYLTYYLIKDKIRKNWMISN